MELAALCGDKGNACTTQLHKHIMAVYVSLMLTLQWAAFIQ